MSGLGFGTRAMFKVVLLGTGGPRPDPKRNATTTLIRLGAQPAGTRT